MIISNDPTDTPQTRQAVKPLMLGVLSFVQKEKAVPPASAAGQPLLPDDKYYLEEMSNRHHILETLNAVWQNTLLWRCTLEFMPEGDIGRVSLYVKGMPQPAAQQLNDPHAAYATPLPGGLSFIKDGVLVYCYNDLRTASTRSLQFASQDGLFAQRFNQAVFMAVQEHLPSCENRTRVVKYESMGMYQSHPVK